MPSSHTSQYHPHYSPGHYPIQSRPTQVYATTFPAGGCSCLKRSLPTLDQLVSLHSSRRTVNCQHKFAHLSYYSHSAPLPVGGH
jgi:hypothetical protein